MEDGKVIKLLIGAEPNSVASQVISKPEADQQVTAISEYNDKGCLTVLKIAEGAKVLHFFVFE